MAANRTARQSRANAAPTKVTKPMPHLFPASRSAGLHRLGNFVPRAGRDYAAGRNTDNGSDGHVHTSLLSPYLRYRMLHEREVVKAVLAKQSFSAAEKYIQEVLWRTYWKGWLEMRPGVWSSFIAERDAMRADFPDQRTITAAENGMTGIDGFDDWARELVDTGYLHNHARMWFASIWIFTLRLPWALGADFFLRHLIDADAASNTLSWRWVAGLQTVGKTYLATAENIARYTNGRYAPAGLATEAVALTEPPVAPPRPLSPPTPVALNQRSLLLVTPDDMHPESFVPTGLPLHAAIIAVDADLLWGDIARTFVRSASTDAITRITGHFGCSAGIAPALDAATLMSAAKACDARQIVTAHAPVGPVADRLAALTPLLADAGIALVQIRRPWDTQFWPHANKGFFAFKEQIPGLLRADGLV